MILWTVRHPPTDSQGVCVGQYQVPITMSFQSACQEVIRKAPFVPDQVWSSDLPRCSTLAAHLTKSWNVPHYIDQRLREISMGDWQGMRYDDLQGDFQWEDWCQNWQTAHPPRGENLNDLKRRVQEWLTVANWTEKSLLVSHAGVVRTLYHLSGLSWQKAMSSSVSHLEWIKVVL